MSNLPPYIDVSDDVSESLARTIKFIGPDKVGILVDEHTEELCLPKISIMESCELFRIESGESRKQLETCSQVWQSLTDSGFTRKSLLINLGGGVIGDMGGFIASTYKRGMSFINVPTTLLSQVDASIGGKLGIDFGPYKNHIGIFRVPDKVIIWDGFLETLPFEELRSGFAEVLKHGLIYDRNYWDQVKQIDLKNHDWKATIKESIAIKQSIVDQDPTEKGLRKILNFGHTVGHGIEGAFLRRSQPIMHGEGVAAGMIIEGYLSHKYNSMSEHDLEELKECIQKKYDPIPIKSHQEVIKLMKQDKKNTHGKMSFSLLSQIGQCSYDLALNEEQVLDALASYSIK
jgi:3-dehydroquinate synthase